MNFKILFQNICMRVDLNKENIVVYILSKILLKISYKYFSSDPLKFFQEILPKYSPAISHRCLYSFGQRRIKFN